MLNVVFQKNKQKNYTRDFKFVRHTCFSLQHTNVKTVLFCPTLHIHHSALRSSNVQSLNFKAHFFYQRGFLSVFKFDNHHVIGDLKSTYMKGISDVPLRSLQRMNASWNKSISKPSEGHLIGGLLNPQIMHILSLLCRVSQWCDDCHFSSRSSVALSSRKLENSCETNKAWH